MSDDMMTSVEAAALLRVSVRTIKLMAREGRVPARKVGRAWRFSRAAIQEWIKGDDTRQKQAD